MIATRGDIDSHSAIFIYKRDETLPDAIQMARAVAKAHRSKVVYTDEQKAKVVKALGYDPTDATGRFVHVAVATTKNDLLTGLANWQNAIPEKAGALLIYAHMGELGMGPMGDAFDDAVTWNELAHILSKRVSSLWLVGCDSALCLKAWPQPDKSPVENWLACTTLTDYWAPLIQLFFAEISLDPVHMPEDVAAILRAKGNVEYLEVANGNKWMRR